MVRASPIRPTTTSSNTTRNNPPNSNSSNSNRNNRTMWPSSDAASTMSDAEDQSGAREVTQEEYYSTLGKTCTPNLVKLGRINKSNNNKRGGGGGNGFVVPKLIPFRNRAGNNKRNGYHDSDSLSVRSEYIPPSSSWIHTTTSNTTTTSKKKKNGARSRAGMDGDGSIVVLDEDEEVDVDAFTATGNSSNHSNNNNNNYYYYNNNMSTSSASSVCNFTIASNDTVKVSNKSLIAESSNHGCTSTTRRDGSANSPVKLVKRWNQLKRGLLGGKDGGDTTSSSSSHVPSSSSSTAGKLQSVSEEGPNTTNSNSSRRWNGGPSSSKNRSRSNSDDGIGLTRTTSNAGGGGGGASRLQREMSARSNNNNNTSSSNSPLRSKQEQAKLDQSILGRFDGLNVLSLGPAYLSSIDSSSTYNELDNDAKYNDEVAEKNGPKCRPETILPWQPLPPYTFTGRSCTLTPADMVHRMLYTTDTPVIVLEGFIPGEDRWSVRIEQIAGSSSLSTSAASKHNTTTASKSSITRTSSPPSSQFRKLMMSSSSNDNTGPPSITPVLTEEDTNSDDGGSPVLPTYQLWPKLWGTNDPAPDRADLERITEEDPLLHLAAEHSIPIDLDENTFCVSDRSHLDIVHNFLSVSLSVGRFDSSVLILSKLLQGMELMMQDDHNLRFLKGATLHNLGLVYVWQGSYEMAVEQFHLAIQERTKTLPKDHIDIAVSMVWKGLAQFALGRFEDALFAMELALEMLPHNEMVRSKVLNNMGVILYQKRKYMLALKQFTASLEIQRGWLDESVRRDSIVYDASTTLGNMGKLYLERGDNDLAYFVYEEALLLQTSIFRKDHDLVLDSLMSLALTRARDHQAKKALSILQGCLRSQNARFGKDSTETINTLGYLGYLYEHLDCHEDALKCLATVKKWQKLHLPPGHPALRKTKESVHQLEESIGTKVSVWV